MSVIDVNVIRPGVVGMLQTNMGLRPGEKVLVVSDYPVAAQWSSSPPAELAEMSERCILGRLVAEIAAVEFDGCVFRFIPFPATGRSGTEPPHDVACAMRESDVVIAITSYSLTHTGARENACLAGARVASMPRFSAEMFYPGGPMAVDYGAVAAEARDMADKATLAGFAEISSPAGTRLRLDLRGRRGLPDDGIYTEKGASGNLPAGEAYIAPLEGSAEGRIVVLPDWYPRLEEPMTILVTAGIVSALGGGGEVGRGLAETWALDDPNPPAIAVARRNIAELGIGTNPNARRADVVLEAEKIRGTVHIGIGDNSHMGGVNVADFHQDFVIPEATLVFDGVAVMEGGRLLT
ncbi:MAG: hypothetical protein HPY55_08920 [Firmicutes bacterium]|nr:hypothetical protein [Bacillota bacterium]